MKVNVPLMEKKSLPMPAFYAALGMAVSYYLLPILISISVAETVILGFLLAFISVISFLRAAYFFLEKDSSGFFYKAVIIVLSLGLGFVMGIASRGNVTDSIETSIPRESVIAVRGILREDPRSLQSGSGLGILEIHGCSGLGGLRASARGNLTVFFPQETIMHLKDFGRGSEIYIDGKLSSGKRGVSFGAVSVHVIKPAPFVERFRTLLRKVLIDRINSPAKQKGDGFLNYGSAGSPVWSGFASALILGVRDDLDTELAESFRNSGCAHILALSGMHLAIISGILAFLLRRPLGIKPASLVGALFILFYVFLIGAQASLVRSAIMYLIGAFSIWSMVKGKSLSLLAMAFIVQLIFQGGGGESLSFILSYLALAGILVLGKSFRSLLQGRLPDIISGSLSASLGAFIMTAPVVAFCFGSLKPVGILAGIVIAPLSSIFMVLSLAALAVSFFSAPLWNFFDFILTQVYRFLELVVNSTGRVPGLTVSNPFAVVGFSVIVGILILLLDKHDTARRKSIASFN